MTTDHLYETETMAELCARQGRLGEAISIYRALALRGPGRPQCGNGRRRRNPPPQPQV